MQHHLQVHAQSCPRHQHRQLPLGVRQGERLIFPHLQLYHWHSRQPQCRGGVASEGPDPAEGNQQHICDTRQCQRFTARLGLQGVII